MDDKVEREGFVNGDERISFFNVHYKLKPFAQVQSEVSRQEYHFLKIL